MDLRKEFSSGPCEDVCPGAEPQEALKRRLMSGSEGRLPAEDEGKYSDDAPAVSVITCTQG